MEDRVFDHDAGWGSDDFRERLLVEDAAATCDDAGRAPSQRLSCSNRARSLLFPGHDDDDKEPNTDAALGATLRWRSALRLGAKLGACAAAGALSTALLSLGRYSGASGAASDVLVAVESDATKCSTLWGQCGGVGFNGSTCCLQGAVCRDKPLKHLPSFRQCVLDTTAPPSTSPPEVVLTDEGGENCSKLWGQCGGEGYKGPKCCQAGSECHDKPLVSLPSYRQCIQKTTPLPPACLDVEPLKDHPCTKKVLWDMETGIFQNPSMYHGLTAQSGFKEFQQQNWKMNPGASQCPQACGPGTCFEVLRYEGCEAWNNWNCAEDDSSLAFHCCCKKYSPNITEVLEKAKAEARAHGVAAAGSIARGGGAAGAAGEETAAAPLAERRPTLFCVALMVPNSYEVDLLQAQMMNGNLGMFSCDYWAIYSNQSIPMNLTREALIREAAKEREAAERKAEREAEHAAMVAAEKAAKKRAAQRAKKAAAKKSLAELAFDSAIDDLLGFGERGASGAIQGLGQLSDVVEQRGLLLPEGTADLLGGYDNESDDENETDIDDNVDEDDDDDAAADGEHATAKPTPKPKPELRSIKSIVFMNESMEVKRGGEYNTALNTPIFMHFWDKVLEHPAASKADWIVKLDPDTVFFPERLRSLVSSGAEGGSLAAPEPEAGRFLNNCHLGMHGPIEVVSRRAMRTYHQKRETCIHGPPSKHGQEDWWLRACFREIGVEKVDAFNTLFEGAWACAERPSSIAPNRPPCFAPQVSFHPFKNIDSYLKCWAEASTVTINGPLFPTNHAPDGTNHFHV